VKQTQRVEFVAGSSVMTAVQTAPPKSKAANFTKLGYTLIAFSVTASAVLLKWRSRFIPQ